MIASGRKLVVAVLVTAAAVAGCGDDEGSTAGQAGAGGSGGAGLGGVQIEGLSGPLTAHFDDRGILSLDCQSNEDCAAALGYFHARDRFVQLDLRRRITTGRLTQMLSEAVRSIGLPIDVENRARYSTRQGEPLEDSIYAQSSDESRSIMQAYSRGVNAWIHDVQAGRNGAQFPREYNNALLFDYDPARIPEWKPSDCVATVLALINSLTNRASLEIERGQRRAALKQQFGDAQGELMFRDLFDTRPDIDSPILPGFGSASASLWRNDAVCAPNGNPDLAPYRGADGSPERRLFSERLLGYPGREGGLGSNNWIVSPSKSASGNALLGNDPHLGLANPALAYIVQIDSKTHGSGDLHVAGMTFPGLPYVLFGQNEHVAWGTTNSNFDLTDVYLEELSADGNSVTFEGAQVPIIKKMVSFAFSDGSSTERELQFVPHHGPVLPRASDSDPMMTMRWAGHDISTDIDFLTELMTASDVYEARTALQNVTAIGSNWVVVDTQGNIAYLPYNRVPRRPWATWYEPAGNEAVPWLPLDGRGGYEWDSYYDLSELPQAINPVLGYLATANNDMTGALFDSDPTDASFGVFQTSVSPGYRHKRIMDLLAQSNAHDMASMEALIADTHSLIGEQLTPHMLQAASGLTLTANAQKLVNALSSWSFDCPTGLNGSDGANSPLSADAAVLLESSGCSAFHVLLRDINNATVNDEGVVAERGPNLVVVKMLKGEPTVAGEIYWDDVKTTDVVETKDDILARTLDSAGSFLVAKLGDDETKWAWGRIHTMTLRSDVDTASSGAVKEFNESGFANNGGLFTVDVANPSADFTQIEGAAVRFLCEALPARPSCTIQVPGGQSGHIDSEHYLDMLPDYLDNVPRQLPMDIVSAAETAAVTLVVSPAAP